MVIAIIPARAGSKRIPGKNIKLFAGRPIIHYSIEAAQKAGCFDKVIVSTDSEKIAQVAKDVGAEVPFIRPAELSDDYTDTQDVLVHALGWLEEHDYKTEYLCCIYPTAPFLLPEYILKGYKIITEKRVSSVFPVTTFPYPIFRALRINETGNLEMIWPKYENFRSQDLTEAYHDAGQFYWLQCDTFLKKRRIFSPDAMPVLLPRYLVQDIDALEDWETAERMLKIHHMVD